MRKLVLIAALGACGGKATSKPPPDNTTKVTCDVSDEDKAAAYFTQLTGQHLDDENRCVYLAPTFPGWVNYGSFAYDRGCEWDKAIYDCALIDYAASKKAMADAGYATADQARRQELLTAWLSEIMDVQVVSEDRDGEFTKYGKTFTPPTFDGTAMTYWESDAGGMSPEVTYTQLKLAVDADGMFGEPEQVDQFTTVYE